MGRFGPPRADRVPYLKITLKSVVGRVRAIFVLNFVQFRPAVLEIIRVVTEKKTKKKTHIQCKICNLAFGEIKKTIYNVKYVTSPSARLKTKKKNKQSDTLILTEFF